MRPAPTILPLPDVTELTGLTTEFAALLEWCDSDLPAFDAPLRAARRRVSVQVLHLDDTRASTWALFAG